VLTANVVPSSPILVTLMMEALRSSETSVLTRVTLTSQKTAFFDIHIILTDFVLGALALTMTEVA
jgi:hypothetical protein